MNIDITHEISDNDNGMTWSTAAALYEGRTNLADGDVQTQRRGVVVLEEVEVGRTSVLHLVADSLASRAREGGNHVRVAGRDGGRTEVLRDRGHVAVRGGRACGRRELSEVDLAVTAEAVRRGLDILLLGEEEHQAAGLASIRRGDVEVEQAGDG